MGRIRDYREDDAAQVHELHRRALLGGREPGPAFGDYLDTFYRKTLFEHAWPDDEIGSLVYELDDGTVPGFVGVIPRPMAIDGRPLRAAVSVRFMVDPDSAHGPLIAAALHRHFLRGPQDLSLVENANAAARRVWEGTRGAAVIPLASISWSTGPDREPPGPEWLGHGHEMDAAELLECVTVAADGYALRPVYTAASLGWLLKFLESAVYRGTLQARVTTDRNGRVEGWYLYYANPSGYNGVLQLHWLTEPGPVFRSLLAHAVASGGAARTTGRLHPGLLSLLGDHGCALSCGPWTVVHSPDPRIVRAVTAGQMFLTRLEGEFC